MPFIRIKKCLTCDVPHEWIFEGPTLRELRQIKAMTGMTGKEFGEAGDNGDPDSLAALVVILHKRDKINLAYDDADIDFTDFEMVPTETEKAEMAELEKRMKAAADAGQADPKTPTLTVSGRNAKAD